MINEKRILEQTIQLKKSQFADNRFTDGVAAVETLINTAPKVGEWIPCSKQLPHFNPAEKRRKVLVTIEDSAGLRFTSTAKYNETDRLWYEFAEHRFYDERKFTVIAWMPKPAPYEGV